VGRVQVLSSTPSVLAAYATDGQRWTRLSGTAGTVGTAPVTALRGAGNLTEPEADALGAALLHRGPLYVAVLAEGALPDAPLTVTPTPATSRRTGLYVAAPSGSTPAPGAPEPGATTGEHVTYTELGSGTNARATDASIQVASTPAEIAAVYAQAYGRQSGSPVPPPVEGGTVVGIFLGQKPTGGYGVRVLQVSAQGAVLTVTVQLRSPGPGTITTQALTSPWTLIRVSGTYPDVRVVDQLGQPLPTSGGTDR
jgi:hypothetical protein